MSQSVDRAMVILQACAEGPRRLGELAGTLDVHRSTVLRILQTMEARRFVRRTADGSWSIGPAMTGIAASALEGSDLRAVAAPWLRRLAGELGHTVHLAELNGGEITYIDKVEGRGAVRMHSRIGAPVQLHTAGVAKVILAFSEPEVRERLLATATFERFTPRTITSPGRFRQELDAVVAAGWAQDAGEHEDFVSCVAVPIRDYTGLARAGLSLTALTAIEPLAALRSHLPRLQEAAADISVQLGFPGHGGEDHPPA